MASLSLQRVLQNKKTSLEIEQENFEKCQTISIGKAVNMIENPVKEKHIRAAIIGTYHSRGGASFWQVMLKQPLLEHRIVAWKFCHVLHKVLREGHYMCLPQSMKHKDILVNVGKLWGHLREGYGTLIKLYSSLLITKLDFHHRNPHIPGNLMLTTDELEKFYGKDINNYFQLSVEMFDYMDDILALQEAIFGSLDACRANSMTSSGQCRLAPLIPCIQDSNQLYDFSVKLLFRLHSKIDPDILAGHRDRFRKQFGALKLFYSNTSQLQYFYNLITIPKLPERPPNFLEQSDLRTYVPPVVVLAEQEQVPEQEEQIREEALLDVSTEPQNELHELISERDALINHLQGEIMRLKNQISHMIAEARMRSENVQLQLESMQSQIVQSQERLEQELVAKKQLEGVVALTQSSGGKVEELEKKSQVQEEKFQKLKELYTNIRDEHVKLLRQKAEVDKVLNVTLREKAQLQEGQKEVETKTQQDSAELSVKYEALLKELEELKSRHEETNSQHKIEMLELQHQFEDLRNEKMTLVEKVECLDYEKKIVENQVSDLVVQRDELDKRLQESLQICKQIKENAEKEEREHQNLIYRLNGALMHSTADNIRRSVNELDEPSASGLACTPDYFRKTIEEACLGLQRLIQPVSAVKPDGTISLDACKNVLACGQSLCAVISQGKGTSNTSTNIDLGERLQESVRAWGTTCANSLDSLVGAGPGSGQGDSSRAESIEELIRSLNTLSALASDMGVTDFGGETLGDQAEEELAGMDAAIEEAARKIEGLLNASRTADSGIKLEVNEKILDACTGLMATIRILVQCSRSVQAEIVAQGKGTATVKEFYKRNHQWTEGLISAAKAVALGAKLLVSAADEAVKGEGKLEVLTVAAQEIAACSVQLVVASRVKAQRGSPGLLALRKASVGVGQSTGAVVAAVKSCAQMVETAQDLDVSGLNLHQAKKLEMESQVRLIELEQSLAMERLRLASLRRQHYQLSGE